MQRAKVLIVDDSAVIRQVLSGIIAGDPQLELMGAVADPIFAMRRMEAAWPDVIVLDVEMPRMDGITFLKKVMSERPTPVVMCSTLTTDGASTTMQALDAGAISIICKPKVNAKGRLTEDATMLVDTVRAAARANMAKVRPAGMKAPPAPPPPPRHTADAVLAPASARAMKVTTDRVVAIGTSTGGTQALETVLKALPPVVPGMVIVQHMPEKFTAAFSARLDSLCQVQVREARNGDRVLPGIALVAPGGRHMMLKRSGAHYHVEVADGPLVSRHRPSVDVLFRSVARAAGRNAMGVIMTGMGDDGVAGMQEMHDGGAFTVAQDEATCVVYGMPKEAVKRGVVDKISGLGQIRQDIMDFSKSH